MNNPFLWVGILLLGLFLSSCQPDTSGTQEPEKTDSISAMIGNLEIDYTDPHSYARPEEAKTKHLSLNLTVDFDNRQLKGYARYRIQHEGADSIILDTRNLDIQRVTLGEDDRPTAFRLGKSDSILGSPLVIAIDSTTELLTVYYRTTPEGAAALDWLAPEQTLGKQAPFLFTQGQAILTRTWIPTQDSPGIRITYDAEVRVPSGMMAVMSATNPKRINDNGRYTFEMKQPIPPYLLALAVGDLRFMRVGPRTGVYAEPALVNAAVFEMIDMERMLEQTETMYGSYLWERYDVIFLPPSFPFGGMENPRLTFATPTIIAGDRSLVSLIAHELAHSWSGNLVTNATWNDFWLNEGFTTYIENRIMEGVYGKEYADMLALLGYQDLQQTVEELGEDSKDTHLKLDLAGRDPDEGMTYIAYEKGANFLRMLEQEAGRDTFDQFIRDYFEAYQFKSLTTEEFLVYLNDHLLQPNDLNVNVEEWVYGPGIPSNAVVPTSSKFNTVEAKAQSFLDGGAASALNPDDWTTHEWLHLIRNLPADLPVDRMRELDEAYELSASGNAEIAAAWFELAIQTGYAPQIIDRIERFLVYVGRRKFLTPLYKAMMENGQQSTARKIYQKARSNYHTVSRNTIDGIVKVEG